MLPLFLGGFVPWIADTIVFTSQHHPDTWWLDDNISPADRAAFAARCVIVEFSEVLQGAQNRLAASRAALGADFIASLPRNAREVASSWLADASAGGRSANLRVPDLPRDGGLPPSGVPLRPVQGGSSLENRLLLLQPSYSVTPVTGPPPLPSIH